MPFKLHTDSQDTLVRYRCTHTIENDFTKLQTRAYFLRVFVITVFIIL